MSYWALQGKLTQLSEYATSLASKGIILSQHTWDQVGIAMANEISILMKLRKTEEALARIREYGSLPGIFSNNCYHYRSDKEVLLTYFQILYIQMSLIFNF
jgi:hypothetical protein